MKVFTLYNSHHSNVFALLRPACGDMGIFFGVCIDTQLEPRDKVSGSYACILLHRGRKSCFLLEKNVFLAFIFISDGVPCCAVEECLTCRA